MRTREQIEERKMTKRLWFKHAALRDYLSTKEKEDIWTYGIYAIAQIDRVIKSMCDLKIHRCLPCYNKLLEGNIIDWLYELQDDIKRYMVKQIYK